MPRLLARRDALLSRPAHHPVRHVGKYARMAVEHRTPLLAGADLGHDRLVDLAIGLAPVLAGRVMPAEVDRIGTQPLDHRQRERVGQAAHHLSLSDPPQAAPRGLAAEPAAATAP